VTTGATDAIRQVFGLREILRFQTGLVTLRTDCGCLSGTEGFEPNDLGDVTAAVNMGLSGTVTSLASVLISLQERSMWSSCKVFVPNFLVAGLANIGLGVLSWR
jgi:hypothetical protein